MTKRKSRGTQNSTHKPENAQLAAKDLFWWRDYTQ